MNVTIEQLKNFQEEIENNIYQIKQSLEIEKKKLGDDDTQNVKELVDELELALTQSNELLEKCKQAIDIYNKSINEKKPLTEEELYLINMFKQSDEINDENDQSVEKEITQSDQPSLKIEQQSEQQLKEEIYESTKKEEVHESPSSEKELPPKTLTPPKPKSPPKISSSPKSPSESSPPISSPKSSSPKSSSPKSSPPKSPSISTSVQTTENEKLQSYIEELKKELQYTKEELSRVIKENEELKQSKRDEWKSIRDQVSTRHVICIIILYSLKIKLNY